MDVLRVSDCDLNAIIDLLNQYDLILKIISDKNIIPGSYWGDAEAGLINNSVYVRSDTPIHSLLHETCHYICMDQERRRKLNTNAAGDYDEENAVCYLQIILSNAIPEMGENRMMLDMDNWGYTFREGSAKNWFNGDAIDAYHWLKKHNILESRKTASHQLRK